MKKAIILLTVVFISVLAKSQVFRYRVIEFTSNKKEGQDKRTWLKDSTSLIVQDLNAKTIKLYTPKETVYAWINTEQKTVKDDDKDHIQETYIYHCIDAAGAKCEIEIDLMTLKEDYMLLIILKADGAVMAFKANII